MNLGERRIDYKPSRDGKPFKVSRVVEDAKGKRKFKFEVSFVTLVRAEEYARDANVSDQAKTAQRQLERQPHKFDDRDGSGICWRCNREREFNSHMGAGGRR